MSKPSYSIEKDLSICQSTCQKQRKEIEELKEKLSKFENLLKLENCKNVEIYCFGNLISIYDWVVDVEINDKTLKVHIEE